MAGRYALLIGISTFHDAGLDRLYAPENDVIALREVLARPEIAGFETCLLLNAGLDETRRRIVAHFKDRAPDDLVLLYYTGHGLRDDRGNLYLALPGSEAAAPDAVSIGAEFVRRQMEYSHARRQVLILDCCHSGAFMPRGAKRAHGAARLRKSDFDPGGHGVFTLAASAADESAFEKDGRSLFTHHLVEALSGTDEIEGSEITIEDLYGFVRRRVATSRAPMQPQLWSDRQTAPVKIANNLGSTPGAERQSGSRPFRRPPRWSRRSDRAATSPSRTDPAQQGMSKRAAWTTLALIGTGLVVVLLLGSATDEPDTGGSGPAADAAEDGSTEAAGTQMPPAPAASGDTAGAADAVDAPDAELPRREPDPTRNEIHAVQTELRRLGLYRLDLDGTWGRGSAEALRSFQRTEGIEPTGTAADGVRLLPDLRAAEAPAPAEAAATCRVRVTHPFASLRETPSHAAVELPVGNFAFRSYDVLATRLVNWAGKRERWYRIRVGDRTGWIVGSSMYLTASGAGCP
jgi:peptidoglycan hydrolase-like protein with peptidoglycan-binding domain